MTDQKWREKFADDELEAFDFYVVFNKWCETWGEANNLIWWARVINKKYGPNMQLKRVIETGDINLLSQKQIEHYIRCCYLSYASNDAKASAPINWHAEASESLDNEREAQAIRKQEEEARSEIISEKFQDLEELDSINAGYVYVVKDIQSGLIKIGRTQSWIRRSKELKVDEISIKLMNIRWVDDSHMLEKYLHDRYKVYRLPQSEWFRLDHTPIV